jgi:hypothetical protein
VPLTSEQVGHRLTLVTLEKEASATLGAPLGPSPVEYAASPGGVRRSTVRPRDGPCGRLARAVPRWRGYSPWLRRGHPHPGRSPGETGRRDGPDVHGRLR